MAPQAAAKETSAEKKKPVSMSFVDLFPIPGGKTRSVDKKNPVDEEQPLIEKNPVIERKAVGKKRSVNMSILDLFDNKGLGSGGRRRIFASNKVSQAFQQDRYLSTCVVILPLSLWCGAMA